MNAIVPSNLRVFVGWLLIVIDIGVLVGSLARAEPAPKEQGVTDEIAFAAFLEKECRRTGILQGSVPY